MKSPPWRSANTRAHTCRLLAAECEFHTGILHHTRCAPEVIVFFLGPLLKRQAPGRSRCQTHCHVSRPATLVQTLLGLPPRRLMRTNASSQCTPAPSARRIAAHNLFTLYQAVAVREIDDRTCSIVKCILLGKKEVGSQLHMQAVGTRLAHAGRNGRHIVCCVTFERTGCDHAVAGVVHVIMSRKFESSRSVCKSLILLTVATYGLLLRTGKFLESIASYAQPSLPTKPVSPHRVWCGERRKNVGTCREQGLGRFCAHY